MHRVRVREARKGLRLSLEQVQAGGEAAVLRRGVDIGRLVRPERMSPPLPDLNGFRAAIKIRGQALSENIREARRGSRF